MALTISATELGRYAATRFCPRCAWVRLHVKPLPYQTFPGIFSTIDRYNKLIVHGFFDRENSLPTWLRQLGEVSCYVSPPHWSKFAIVDPGTGVTLRGEADGIFKMADGSHSIVDYKTSKYSRAQGGLFPVYRVQLNAYAFIGERLDVRPVSGLALIYMEPVTDDRTAADPGMVDDVGFSMDFAATVVPVDLDPDRMIPPLLERAKEIGDMEDPPPGLQGCKDCEASEGLINALR